MAVNVSEDWLLANGIDRETLSRALAASPCEAESRRGCPVLVIPGQPGVIEATKGDGWWQVKIADWRPTSKNMHRKGVRAWCAARSRDDVVLSLWRRHPDCPPDATTRRRVSCLVERRRAAGRLLDPQNIEECLYDCLVKAGLLIDDDSRWLERGPTDVKPNPGIEWAWRTTIKIEEC